MLRGQMVMPDWAAADEASTTIPPGGTTSRFTNLIYPTAASLEAGVPVYVVDDDSVADNGEVNVIAYGFCTPLACGDSRATTAVDKLDPIGIGSTGSSSQLYIAEAAAANARVLGVWLEDAHATLDQYKAAFWTGGIPCVGTTF